MASNISSVGSAKSIKTSASSVSAARARAEAEAAKVRASYASQEAKLKMEKAAREAERATRDAQNKMETTRIDTEYKLETTRIDTELEVLTLHREADAAMVTAQVLEDAEAMQSVVEDGKSESEKMKIKRTSEYVQSQIDLKNRSPSSPLPVAPSIKAKSHDTFMTWHPAEEDDYQPQPVSKENADSKQPSPPHLHDPTKAETKAKVSRANPTMHAHAPSYTHTFPSNWHTHVPFRGAFGTVFGTTRPCDFRAVPVR